MKIIFRQGGDIEFPEGIPEGLTLKAFQPHPTLPNVFTSKLPSCRLRTNRCRLSPCGKRAIFQWTCSHYKKAVSLEDCDGCTNRQSEQSSPVD